METESGHLETLLDSALDDLQTLKLSHQRKVVDDDTEACKHEEPCPFLPGGVKGLGVELPDLRRKKGKQGAPRNEHFGEALDKLKKHTKHVVKELESGKSPELDIYGGDANAEDWIKQFEDLVGSQEMESVVETMMHQLLSKEILHDPMKEIEAKYPRWLQENKANLTTEELDRFSCQYQLITKLNKVYNDEPGNFNKIVDIMQQMQQCGQPPNDIVKELAPDANLVNLMSTGVSENQSCCIM